MAGVKIAYSGTLIAEMDAQGTKTLHTSGKYCKNNIQVAYDPPSGGAELPELETPGTAGDLMEGKQLLDGAGAKVTGTFTIAPELAEQAALIDEIRETLLGKTAGGAPEDLAAVLDEQAAAIAELKALLGSKASGGGGAEIPWLTREVTEYSSDTLTELGPYALSGTRVVSLHLPALTTIAGYAFYNCTALADLALPALTEIPINGFREFTGITKADFGALKKIGSNGFYKCTALETLIIRTGSVCTLAAGTVWTGTPILAGTGFIYVPGNLLDQYASAKNFPFLY